jgi:uncharacterized protein
MFIDIHAHTSKYPTFPYCDSEMSVYSTPEQLISRYDKLNIDKGVLLPVVNPECSYTLQSNDEIIEIAETTGRFIPFCNIDPRALKNSWRSPLGDILKYYRDKGCKGIGEVCANLDFLNPMVQNLFKGASEAQMPLTFHISPTIGGNYGLFDEAGLSQLEKCLQRFPKLKFFGHSQAFWAEIAPLKHPKDRWEYPEYPVEEDGRIACLMRKYPNLYGDLSAGSGYNSISRDREYGIKFMNEFQDRLMFGTDICLPNTPTPLAAYLLELKQEGAISDSVFSKIARVNAIKILNLNF